MFALRRCANHPLNEFITHQVTSGRQALEISAPGVTRAKRTLLHGAINMEAGQRMPGWDSSSHIAPSEELRSIPPLPTASGSSRAGYLYATLLQRKRARSSHLHAMPHLRASAVFACRQESQLRCFACTQCGSPSDKLRMFASTCQGSGVLL
jgi:hypothetical protein